MIFDETSVVSKNAIVAERRIGKLHYTHEFLVTTPQAVFKNLFGRLIPVKVEFDYATQAFAMTAFSEDFEPVEQGEPIPLYQVTVKVVKGKRGPSYYISFAQVETNPLAGLFS